MVETVGCVVVEGEDSAATTVNSPAMNRPPTRSWATNDLHGNYNSVFTCVVPLNILCNLCSYRLMMLGIGTDLTPSDSLHCSSRHFLASCLAYKFIYTARETFRIVSVLFLLILRDLLQRQDRCGEFATAE